MPSNLKLSDSNTDGDMGVLYIVSTPIGNLDDITLRAIKTLSSVDIIAAEDTRHTGKLLARLEISSRLFSYHEHNEKERSKDLISKLKGGATVALVSDAGTPSVSDPGFRLVKTASEEGIEIVPIPGVSAVITALSASGLPTDSFVFAGFPVRKKGRRIELLRSLSSEKRTLIFYDSPKRIITFIEELIEVMGDRPAVLAREMTKIHEEFIRGCLSDISDVLSKRHSVKGECTLIVSGKEDIPVFVESLEDEIRERLKSRDIRPSELAKELAAKYSIQKAKIYEKIHNVLDNETK